MDDKTKILIFFPLTAVIILAVIACYLPFKRGLSASEESVLNFNPAGLAIKDVQKVSLNPDFKSLLDFTFIAAEDTAQTDNASVPANNSIASNDLSVRGLSLIIISGENRTAIIKGVPLKEGEQIADMKVVKIEPDRVLIKDKTLQWMYMD